MQTDLIEAVWGAENIGKLTGTSLRKTFYLLERGLLPARKVGGVWQSTRGELRDFLLGRSNASNRREMA